MLASYVGQTDRHYMFAMQGSKGVDTILGDSYYLPIVYKTDCQPPSSYEYAATKLLFTATGVYRRVGLRTHETLSTDVVAHNRRDAIKWLRQHQEVLS